MQIKQNQTFGVSRYLPKDVTGQKSASGKCGCRHLHWAEAAQKPHLYAGGKWLILWALNSLFSMPTKSSFWEVRKWFESFTKDQRREWFLRIACIALAIVVIVEGMYIWQHGHRAPGRFKAVNEWGEWDGLLAFDTATGQLCRRTRWKPSPTRNAPETHPAQESQPSKSSGDPILDAIVGRHVDTEAAGKAARAKEAEEAAQYAREVEFVRSLPACADIH